jgi:hypothetical protein
MHQGRSMFQVPPPIHGSMTTDTVTLSPSTSKGYASQSKLANRKVAKKDLDGSSPRIPPTLSGFRSLSSLAILDMDTLEYASELKSCISNSISTLSSLKLSFSDALSNQSRRPPPEAVSDDDSDQEDEFPVGLPPGMPPVPGQNSTGSGSTDQNGASKVISSMEQKKNQEVFLSRIFGIEPPASSLKSTTPPGNESDPVETLSIVELRSKFLKTLSPIFSKLFASAKDTGTAGPAEADVFEIMRNFAEIEETFAKSKDSQSLDKTAESPDVAETADSQSLEQAAGTSEGSTSKEAPVSSLDGQANEAGLFDTVTSKKENLKPGVSDPDDVDVNEPETKELSLDTEVPGDPDDTKTKLESSPEKLPSDINSSLEKAQVEVLKKHAQVSSMAEEIKYNVGLLKTRYMKLAMEFEAGISTDNPYAAMEVKAAEDLYTSRKAILDGVESTLREIRAEVEDINNGFHSLDPNPVTIESRNEKIQEMEEYVRKTRGLTLETLAIYLIPIKASILSKAVDLGHLRSITLLNVGLQTTFWQHMARQNIASPLPLHKIHTDHVTIAFLSCVAQLNNLTELFLLERTAKTKVETMASRTTVNIEHIRRLVIKRHAATLKILMLRNDAGQEWDLNVKTAMLLCQRAKALEELAVSFGVRIMVSICFDS